MEHKESLVSKIEHLSGKCVSEVCRIPPWRGVIIIMQGQEDDAGYSTIYTLEQIHRTSCAPSESFVVVHLVKICELDRLLVQFITRGKGPVLC